MSAGQLSRFFQSPFNAALFRWCPPGLSRRYMRVMGKYYFRHNPEEKECHLRLVRQTLGRRMTEGRGPELERRVLRGVFDHYFEKMLTAYWGYERVRSFLLRHVRLVNGDLLDAALAQGRGVILTTGHFGGLEFIPGALTYRKYPVTMVVRFQTRKLKVRTEEIAGRAGIELLDADDGAVLPRALAAIREGRIFITELDEIKHWRPRAGKVMNLFGRRVSLDRTVELLHRRTGAPVLLALMERVGRHRYQLVFEAPAEHHAAPTGLGPDAQLLKRLEHYIYDRPDHWYIWKELAHLKELQPT